MVNVKVGAPDALTDVLTLRLAVGDSEPVGVTLTVTLGVSESEMLDVADNVAEVEGVGVAVTVCEPVTEDVAEQLTEPVSLTDGVNVKVGEVLPVMLGVGVTEIVPLLLTVADRLGDSELLSVGVQDPEGVLVNDALFEFESVTVIVGVPDVLTDELIEILAEGVVEPVGVTLTVTLGVSESEMLDVADNVAEVEGVRLPVTV